MVEYILSTMLYFDQSPEVITISSSSPVPVIISSGSAAYTGMAFMINMAAIKSQTATFLAIINLPPLKTNERISLICFFN